MIELYEFGKIIIDNRKYTSDIIIYPDGRVMDNWWRDQGHLLTRNDIRHLIETSPEIIIAGTGSNGLMKPEEGLDSFLAGIGIKLIAQPSKEAVKTFNKISPTKKTGACFHLTC